MNEILDHLEADEAGTDHERTAGGRDEGRHRRVDVVDVAQRKHAFPSGDRRPHGRRARRKHQCVIRLRRLRPGNQVAHQHCLGRAIDGDDLVVHAHVEVEPAAEGRRGLQQEIRTLLDEAAEVIRKTAVGERDMPAPLEHDDVGVLVESTEAGGCGHAAGDAADDDVAVGSHDSHSIIPPGV